MPVFPSLKSTFLIANGVTCVVEIVDNFEEDADAGPNDLGVPEMVFKNFTDPSDGVAPATWYIS